MPCRAVLGGGGMGAHSIDCFLTLFCVLPSGLENTQYIKEQLAAQVLFVHADVSKEEDVQRLVQSTVDTFGDCHHPMHA